MEQQSNESPPLAGLENIKRIVVLMFENRSFDHLFGGFPGVNGLFEKINGITYFKQDCYNLQDPLSPPSPNNQQYFPTPVDPAHPMQHDFTHDFGDGMMPDLFGPVFTVDGDPALPSNQDATYTSGYKNGQLVGAITPIPTTYPPTNSGFFTTYNTFMQQGQSVMTYFTNGTPRILHKLAQQFVLCDNWYCDMPGHTLPNRAFIHCATTGDTGIDDSDGGMVGENSVFDLMTQQQEGTQQQGATWQMYTPVDNAGNQGQLDTRFLNPGLQPNTGATLTQFAIDCENGTLPFYSFIMCWLPGADNYTDTSMHPASMIQPGENLLAAVYNTLYKSPCWEDTLLVVTFDENGGIYDHVMPPATTPPDPKAKPFVQTNTSGCCGNLWQLDATFDFSLLGLRVPALLISPWLYGGIDSSQYQNTSVTRFVIDRMNAIYGTDTGYLKQRDANAPLLDTVFSQFGSSTMREDCPEWITPYPTLPCTDPATCSNKIPYDDGTLAPWTPPDGIDDAPPVSYINELLSIYVALLPGHPDSGKKITRSFITNAEVSQYIKEREQAAGLYYQSKNKGTGV